MGGVSVQDCTDVSKHITEQFFVRDMEAYTYRLEVSSPGIDRPLKTSRDFARNINKAVSIRYKEHGKEITLEGTITAVDDMVHICRKPDIRMTIPVANIIAGKIKIQKWLTLSKQLFVRVEQADRRC